MKSFPFITLQHALIVLRVLVAFVFITHAVVRIFNGTIERFGSFLTSKGLVFGTAIVWMITFFEIVGGGLLVFNYFRKALAAGFIAMLLVGIILIHASQGWFVGEHGTGGSEYSVVLIVSLLVIAASDKKTSLTD